MLQQTDRLAEVKKKIERWALSSLKAGKCHTAYTQYRTRDHFDIDRVRSKPIRYRSNELIQYRWDTTHNSIVIENAPIQFFQLLSIWKDKNLDSLLLLSLPHECTKNRFAITHFFSLYKKKNNYAYYLYFHFLPSNFSSFASFAY